MTDIIMVVGKGNVRKFTFEGQCSDKCYMSPSLNNSAKRMNSQGSITVGWSREARDRNTREASARDLWV